MAVEAYKKQDSGGPVALIDRLKNDLKMEMQEDDMEEEQAQKDYEETMAQSAKKRATDSKTSRWRCRRTIWRRSRRRRTTRRPWPSLRRSVQRTRRPQDGDAGGRYGGGAGAEGLRGDHGPVCEEACNGLEDHRGEGAADGRGGGHSPESDGSAQERVGGAHGAQGVHREPAQGVRLPAPELRRAQDRPHERDRGDQEGQG